MARMLGRARVPGCCPGAREGRPGPDCSGGHPEGTRAAKRREQHALSDELAAELREALERSERGETVDLGSFAQYADGGG